MSSQDKMLGILSLFSDAKVEIGHDDVVATLGCSRATAYRYLKALGDSGVLTSISGGAYVLGPRIVELDRLIRRNDPLLTAARPVMEALCTELHASVMLCSYYGDQVLCTDSIWKQAGEGLDYERGRPMSMFAGAMAKVILANVSPYQLRSLMLHHTEEIRMAGLGENWKEFNANMQRIRRERTCVTHAEVVPGLTGVAAPIFDPEKRVLGSITLVVSEGPLSAVSDALLRTRIADAAQSIGDGLSGLRLRKSEAHCASDRRTQTAAKGEVTTPFARRR
ncbi:IclR family transcriptional regulator C-terminal domain-containing protein [Polaromonas sp. YR568]|uniref:IclR family transcriptional regulator n=1 Tax=Polaromonas sp. YR568 TaxID=1855301 RepID=UPI003137F4D6